MKLETFYAELFRRLALRDGHIIDDCDTAKDTCEAVNIMTGGAFYKSVANLPEDYVFPTEVGE